MLIARRSHSEIYTQEIGGKMRNNYLTRAKRGGLKNVKEQSKSGYSDSEESSRQQANYIQS